MIKGIIYTIYNLTITKITYRIKFIANKLPIILSIKVLQRSLS